jgi:thioester reductase-like protein
MNKPIVLLTGATGFLGSHLLEALLNKAMRWLC